MNKQQILAENGGRGGIMSDPKVSIYRNVSDTEGELISISTILKGIKNGRWKEQTEKLRSIQDEKAQKAYKNTLPCFTPSGDFSKRNNEALLKHSGFLFLDIDAKDNPILLQKDETAKVRKQLIADRHTCFLFTSCRGLGLCAGMRIDGNRHEESFLFLEKYFKEKYGLVVDNSCKDVARLRFISYDPDLYLSEGAETVIVPESFLKESRRKNINTIPGANGKEHEIMQKIISTGRLLSDDSYESWLQIGFALANTFGEAGREYFHALSRGSSKYDPVECDKKYGNCFRTNKGEVSFATIVHLAKEAGIDLPANTVTEVKEVNVSQEELIPNCEFPIDVFPSEFQKLINGVSVSMDINNAVVATILLTILSASAGNTVKVSPKRDYYVAPFLWAGIVLPPGTAKSPTINMLVSPIKKMQSKAHLKYKQEMQEYEIKLNAFKKDKTGTVEQPELPIMEQFYVSDSTVEALADVFESQPRAF